MDRRAGAPRRFPDGERAGRLGLLHGGAELFRFAGAPPTRGGAREAPLPGGERHRGRARLRALHHAGIREAADAVCAIVARGVPGLFAYLGPVAGWLLRAPYLSELFEKGSASRLAVSRAAAPAPETKEKKPPVLSSDQTVSGARFAPL